TGFLHQELVDELKDYPIRIVHNPDWNEGMSSSIKTGIHALLESENAHQINAVLFLLSDQPLITSDFLQELIQQFYTDKNSILAATAYAGTQGVPAVFGKRMFPILQQLSGKGGAGSLFKKYAANLITVPFANAAIDIDTEEDYLRLINAEQNRIA
ncbi:MAG: nucleotidyltransferase family protein, partial [Sphingobacteriaceae bacterium]